MKELPNYEITVDLDDDLSGLDAISIVNHPAVQVDFLCFAENQRPVKFSDDRHIITGVAILADTPIYRRDSVRGEYTVTFSPKTIGLLVEKMSRDGLINSVNLEHDDKAFVDSCVMVESYIKDSKRGIVPVEFSDIPDGSWIVSYKVEDDDLWEAIKTSGKLNGFSVQGIFDLVESKFAEAMEFAPLSSMSLEERIENAIDMHYRCSITYTEPRDGTDGEDFVTTFRDVVVVAYGISDAGNDVIRAFQVSGESQSQAKPAWRLFRLDRIMQFTPERKADRYNLPFPLYDFDNDFGMAFVYKIAKYTEPNIDKAEQRDEEGKAIKGVSKDNVGAIKDRDTQYVPKTKSDGEQRGAILANPKPGRQQNQRLS